MVKDLIAVEGFFQHSAQVRPDQRDEANEIDPKHKGENCANGAIDHFVADEPGCEHPGKNARSQCPAQGREGGCD